MAEAKELPLMVKLGNVSLQAFKLDDNLFGILYVGHLYRYELE